VPEAVAQASKASQLWSDPHIGITLVDVPATNSPGRRKQANHFACDVCFFISAFVWTYPTAPSKGSSLEEEEVMRVFSLCRTTASFQCNIKETNKQDRIGT
jgi:hypothetical protein